MLTGEGAMYVNGHKMAMLSVALPGDNVRLRLLKGSLERTRGIDTGTGDNDLDYEGIDVLLTRSATDLPVALAFGAARYEEAYHLGYPDEDRGGSEFVHRWGPHVSALRSWHVSRFFDVWAEADCITHRISLRRLCSSSTLASVCASDPLASLPAVYFRIYGEGTHRSISTSFL